MILSCGAMALNGVKSARHHWPRTALHGASFRRQGVCLRESLVVMTAAVRSGARSGAMAHRCMHISCKRLDEAAGQGRAKAVTDTLLSQWSRRSGAALARMPPVLGADQGSPAFSFTNEVASSLPPAANIIGGDAAEAVGEERAPVLQLRTNMSAAPPSIEELLAEVDEDDKGTSSAPLDFHKKKCEVLRGGERLDASLLSGANPATFPSATSSERVESRSTASATLASGTPASSMADAALLEALLQEPFSEDTQRDIDHSSEDDVVELEDEAPREAGADLISGPSCALADEQQDPHEPWRAVQTVAVEDDADGVADAEMEPIDEALDEEESMESVLEEEAERLFRAALASTAMSPDTAADSGAWRALFGDYKLFSKEAAASAVESLSASGNATPAAAAGALPLSERRVGATLLPTAEFDEEAAREAEMESVGDVMATSGSAAVAAGEVRKGGNK
ncbi:hypothetical protein LSCM1_02727 [Leishmania martiniquensis]|uniref:Uncharacterized protein n=1 Tax=Leishmania martiniquensis TaxID=1580590 RepID=A0A836KAP7_9TRYP|nr:hypothetical protein LSCM1_02727 [Leishmania martiniquensis]